MTSSTRIRETRTTVTVDGRNRLMPWVPSRMFWLVGIPLIALFTIAATIWAIGSIQGDLEDQTRADLAAAGISDTDLTVNYTYRDGIIAGALPEGVTADGALGAVDYDGIRSLTVEATEVAGAGDPPAETTTTLAAVVATGPTEVSTEISDGSVVLRGEVLTEAQRDVLVSAAQARFGIDNVDDQLTVSGLDVATEGADARVGALAAAISVVGDGVDGEFSLDDTTLVFAGSAPDQESADALIAAVESATGVAGTATIEVVAPEPTEAVADLDAQVGELNGQLDALAAEIRDTVVFASSSAELTDEAKATLDKVVAAMEQFSLPVVEIVGHTDSSGGADSNLTLSDERAGAVADYLVEQGIAAERLQSRGAGEEEPIASNDTDEGKAQNRRTELVALPSF